MLIVTNRSRSPASGLEQPIHVGAKLSRIVGPVAVNLPPRAGALSIVRSTPLDHRGVSAAKSGVIAPVRRDGDFADGQLGVRHASSRREWRFGSDAEVDLDLSGES